MSEKKFLSKEGITYFWEKILQNFPNNKTFTAAIEAIDEVKINNEDLVAITNAEIDAIIANTTTE